MQRWPVSLGLEATQELQEANYVTYSFAMNNMSHVVHSIVLVSSVGRENILHVLCA